MPSPASSSAHSKLESTPMVIRHLALAIIAAQS